MKRLLLALLLSTSAAAHAQSLSKALVVPTCASGRELEQAGPGLQQLTMDTQGRLCAAATNAGGANMVTPLMVNTFLVPAATLYGQNPFGSNWNTIAVRGSPSAIPGTLSNLTVHTQTAVTTGYYTFSFNVAGVQTPAQCSIGQGGPNLGTTTQCSDLVDTVAVHSGDIIAFSSIGSGAPSATGNVSLSGLFTSANGQEGLIGGATNNFMAQTGASYLGPSQLAALNGTELPASVVMPAAGVLDHLYISLGNVPAAGSAVQFTVFKNGAATGITVTCTNATGLRCSDLVDALSVAVGDTISLRICPSTTVGCPAGVAIGNVTMAFSLRWQPTVLHQAVLFANANGLSTSVSGIYSAIAASLSYNVDETLYRNIAPGTMTLGNLTVALCPDIASTPRSMTLRSNSIDQPPSVTLPAGSNACPTLRTGQDPDNTYQATAGQLLTLVTALTSAAGNSAANFKTSMTAVVP